MNPYMNVYWAQNTEKREDKVNYTSIFIKYIHRFFYTVLTLFLQILNRIWVCGIFRSSEFVSKEKEVLCLVAGAGFEPATFRL